MGRKRKREAPSTPRTTTFAQTTSGVMFLVQNATLRVESPAVTCELDESEFPLDLSELEHERGPRMLARTPVDGATVKMEFFSPEAIANGERHTKKVREAYRRACSGSSKRLVQVLKLWPIFETHPDVRPKLDALAERDPALASYLRGDVQRGRRFAPSPRYARVEEVRQRDPKQRWLPAMKTVFAQEQKAAGSTNVEAELKAWEAFRRAVYEERERCEPFQLPTRIDLDVQDRQKQPETKRSRPGRMSKRRKQ